MIKIPTITILILFFYVPSISYGETYRIASEIVTFESFEGVEISHCKELCEAKQKLMSLKKIGPPKIKRKKTFMSSVGSDACEFINGKAILGKNLKNDGRAFCVLNDQSLIEINSLGRYVEKIFK